MQRSFVLSLATAALLVACSHGGGEQPTSTTTTTSATVPTRTMIADPVDRLTDAICRHERECARTKTPWVDGASWPGGATCINRVKPQVERRLSSLSCSPAEVRAGLKDCVAAVEEDDCTGRHVNIVDCRAYRICPPPAPEFTPPPIGAPTPEGGP